MKQTWYLGATANDVADRCILVGDPGRVHLFADRLQDTRVVNERRALLAVTGRFGGMPITVAAFGMGAPIAAVVMEELAALGARVFLRAGTAMSLGPELPLGSFVVGIAGMREEGTSRTYAPAGYPAVADLALTNAVVDCLTAMDLPHRIGVIASDDGFYGRFLAQSVDQEAQVERRLGELRRLRVLAGDMETAAVLTVAAVRGVRAASLCLVSVDACTRTRLDPERMRRGEHDLVEAALRAVSVGSGPQPAGRETEIEAHA